MLRPRRVPCSALAAGARQRWWHGKECDGTLLMLQLTGAGLWPDPFAVAVLPARQGAGSAQGRFGVGRPLS